MADEPSLAVDLAALTEIGVQLEYGWIGQESDARKRRPVDADPLLAFDCYGSLAAFTETAFVWNAELDLIGDVLRDVGWKIRLAAAAISEGDLQVTRVVDGLR